MFHSARIKLTLWYLLIIMFISGLFSFVAYQALTNELNRGLHLQMIKMNPSFHLYQIPATNPWNIFNNNLDHLPKVIIDQEVVDALKARILWRIIFANIIILTAAGIASYYLAGQTLHPIEVMMEDQKRFIADASHELRTPLTAIKSEIEVALRAHKITGQEARSLLQSNLEEVNKIQSLTNYLLSMSKYEDQTLDLPKQSLNLAEIAETAIKQTLSLREAKNIQLTQHLEKISIPGNLISLEELIRILLDNAIKYSSSGGQISISTFKKGSHAVLTLQDFGAGIKASELPYIFNRFYRADSSRNKLQVDGYGLGLAIAQKIVDLHHGKITVFSKPGQGSTFIVSLPV